MHDLVSDIQVIAAALGALATAWAVFHKSNRDSYANIIDVLKEERDGFRKDYHQEHEQRLKAEAEVEKLKQKIDKLKEH